MRREWRAAPRETEMTIRAALDKLYLGSGYLAAAFMAGIGVCVVAQIVFRTFGRTLDATEASGFCMAAATFLGLAHTLRSGAHVRITLLAHRLSPRHQHGLQVLICLLGVVVVGYLTWHVWSLALQSREFHDISPGLLAMPMWIPQAGAAFGITVLAIALVDELFWLLGGGASRCEAPDEIGGDQPVA